MVVTPLSALSLCEGNPPATGGFPKGPVMRSFDVPFHVRMNKLLNKQPRGRWIEMFWRSFNVPVMYNDSVSITGELGPTIRARFLSIAEQGLSEWVETLHVQHLPLTKTLLSHREKMGPGHVDLNQKYIGGSFIKRCKFWIFCKRDNLK